MRYDQPTVYGQGYQQPSYPQTIPYPPPQQQAQMGQYGGSPPYGNSQPVYGANFTAPVQMIMDVPLGPFYNAETDRRLHGVWSDGLFDCFNDCSLCCLGTLFPCYPVYVIFSLIPTYIRVRASLCRCSDPTGATLCCCIFPFCAHVGLILVLIQACNLREAVARLYMIPPTTCLCCQATFCQCCLYQQIARHLKKATGYTM
jgi:Cys-rich protein (TIGR01571 family)